MLKFATVHIATLTGYQSPVLSNQVNSCCAHLPGGGLDHSDKGITCNKTVYYQYRFV